jgi:hypothetical protein
MGEVIGLGKQRKARERAARRDEAAANRAKFGLPGAEKKKARSEAEAAARRHEAHRLDAPDPERAKSDRPHPETDGGPEA